MSIEENKLNFACGDDIREDWDNCDYQESEKVIYCDANIFPYPLKENHYDYILLKQCLICFNDPKRCLTELHKFCNDDALIEIQVAHCSNMGQYSDLDVKHSFNEKAFIHYAELDSRIEEKKIYDIEEIYVQPSKVGMFMPGIVRKYLSYFIMGLNQVMIIKLRAIK